MTATMPCQYDDAGPWNGGAACATGHKPGSKAFGEYIVATYGGRFEGFNCRQNTADASKLSVHGTGRAVDYYPPDKATGDEVAAVCVELHEAWGIQMVIWFSRDWMSANGWTSYSGPSPHEDHLHIEQTIAGAEKVVGPDFYDQGVLTVAEVDKIIKKLDAIGDQVKDVREAQKRFRETQLRHGEALQKVAKGESADDRALADLASDLDAIRADLASG